jgi:hypothetical protein
MISKPQFLGAAAGLFAIATMAAPTVASASNDNPCLKQHSPAGAVYWNTKCRTFNTYHAPQHGPYQGQVVAPSHFQIKQHRAPLLKPKRSQR